MGQAKANAAAQSNFVWHHTSSLRTAQLWTSGHIKVEGRMPPAFHPEVGWIYSNAAHRREMKDFPPLVWLTRDIKVPQSIRIVSHRAKDNDPAKCQTTLLPPEVTDAIAMRRMAIGFNPNEIGATPWTEHPGYSSGEGRQLNESAIEAGDAPEDWYVVEADIDLLKCRALRIAQSTFNLKMVREDRGVAEIHRMVRLCRENPGRRIAPTWLNEESIRRAQEAGTPIFELLNSL